VPQGEATKASGVMKLTPFRLVKIGEVFWELSGTGKCAEWHPLRKLEEHKAQRVTPLGQVVSGPEEYPNIVVKVEG
jgi:hypothetical protein